MQTLTRLILLLWGVLFPTRARAASAARGQASATPESASTRPPRCRLEPRRSIGDISRSPRARRSSAVGQSKNSSDPDDIAFCAWMYYLN